MIKRFLASAAAALLLAGTAHAAADSTAIGATVAPDVPGSWTFSVGGWGGGGTVTGFFSGADNDVDGQLSSFDGEVTAFGMSYSGGSIVAPFSLGFGDLFGLVWDFDAILGDGLILDIEGIGAANAPFYFAIGPGPVGICGAGQICGIIEGEAAAVPEPGMLALIGLAGLAALRRRKH
jgi:MYXO-CTERM domain-containing protein